jgi:hypothetical protein
MIKHHLLLAVVLIACLGYGNTCYKCKRNLLQTDNFCQYCGSDLSKVYDFGEKTAIAQYKSDVVTPLKLSLGGAAGIPWDEKCTVVGLDASIFILGNYAVYGIGVGGLGAMSRESFGVFCSGMVMESEIFGGIRVSGILNESKESYGLEIALSNSAENLYGMQIGIENNANKMRGVQIGVLNYAASDVKGVQIGLINEIGVKTSKTSLPLLNMRF